MRRAAERKLPRHAQSHEHLHVASEASASASAVATTNAYPACVMVAAHSMPTTNDSMIAARAVLETREKASEKYISDFANAVHGAQRISSQLAFGTFAPGNGEKLSEIFAKYSGSPE